jgi:hypothetical protein
LGLWILCWSGYYCFNAAFFFIGPNHRLIYTFNEAGPLAYPSTNVSFENCTRQPKDVGSDRVGNANEAYIKGCQIITDDMFYNLYINFVFQTSPSMHA